MEVKLCDGDTVVIRVQFAGQFDACRTVLTANDLYVRECIGDRTERPPPATAEVKHRLPTVQNR